MEQLPVRACPNLVCGEWKEGGKTRERVIRRERNKVRKGGWDREKRLMIKESKDVRQGRKICEARESKGRKKTGEKQEGKTKGNENRGEIRKEMKREK